MNVVILDTFLSHFLSFPNITNLIQGLTEVCNSAALLHKLWATWCFEKVMQYECSRWSIAVTACCQSVHDRSVG